MINLDDVLYILRGGLWQYHKDCRQLNLDKVADYLEQIADEAEENKNLCEYYRGKSNELLRKCENLQKERDAAIADLKEVTNRDGSCCMCKYSGEQGCSNKEYIAVCSGKNNLWEWRGVQEEEQ